MTVKKCYKCSETKDISEFHKNSRRSDGLQNYCKSCAKIRNREYYLSTPHKNVQRQLSNKKAKQLAREFVWNYLLEHPCVDCGFTNPVALEFDHIQPKRYNISNMVQQGMCTTSILEEIDKCEVRCANCHRIVTAKRGNWWSK